MILITALLPIDWFTYCYGSAFFKWKESRFTIRNVHRSDLQWQMYIVGIVFIRVMTLITLLLMDFDLLYNINTFSSRSRAGGCETEICETIIDYIPCAVFSF